MHDLAGSVNTGIRTTRAKNVDRLVRYLRERLFQLLLYAADFVLPLPAVVLAAIVFDAQRDFVDRRLLHLRHQYKYS